MQSTQITELESTLLQEMQAIVHLAETTASPAIQQICKTKLKQLSEIPDRNPWGMETVKTYTYEYTTK
jgi:hypothetical protein